MICWGDEAREGVEVNKEACEVGRIRDGGRLRGGVTTEEGGTCRGGEEGGEEETGGAMARSRVSCEQGVVRLEGVAWRRGGETEKLAGEGGAVSVDRVDGEGATRGVGRFCGETGGEGGTCGGGVARGRGAGEKGVAKGVS